MRIRFHSTTIVVIAIAVSSWLSLAAAVLGQSASFQHVGSTNGQVIRQAVSTRSTLNTVYEQSNQLISSSSKDTSIVQQRTVAVIEADSAKTPTVQVTYEKATERKKNKLLARAEQQSVSGKSYVVKRIDDELVVTYPNGQEPPREELAIVKVNMQSVGRPNPLATWLDGRTVNINEPLTLPAPIAEQLLGSWLGDSALHVELKMVKLHTYEGQPAATFEIQMSGSHEDGRQPMVSSGQVTVGVANCRTLQLKMKADVDLTEQRGPEGAQFTVANNGEIQIQMKAAYAD